MATQPWAAGPREILEHRISLLRKDSDKNRRLALLSVDNAVELTIKTYLGLPKRINGINVPRKEYAEFSESFPKLLDALEQYEAARISGIELGEITKGTALRWIEIKLKSTQSSPSFYSKACSMNNYRSHQKISTNCSANC
jgi:hypothetical protein